MSTGTTTESDRRRGSPSGLGLPALCGSGIIGASKDLTRGTANEPPDAVLATRAPARQCGVSIIAGRSAAATPEPSVSGPPSRPSGSGADGRRGARLAACPPGRAPCTQHQPLALTMESETGSPAMSRMTVRTAHRGSRTAAAPARDKLMPRDRIIGDEADQLRAQGHVLGFRVGVEAGQRCGWPSGDDRRSAPPGTARAESGAQVVHREVESTLPMEGGAGTRRISGFVPGRRPAPRRPART